MKMNRRQFVQASAAAAALLAARGRAYGYSVSPGLTKFIDTLPTFGGAIPLATKDTTKYTGVDYYDIVADQFRQAVTSSPPAGFGTYTGTRLYGYRDAAAASGTGKALGGAIIATKGTPVRIKYRSALPGTHIIPFDPTIPLGPGFAGGVQDRIAIHLHGGLVPWASDGGPFHWVDPKLATGTSNVAWLPDDTGLPTFDLFYPNEQSARLMWYHDHAIGTTRTSAYAGLASAYVLTDPTDLVETGLNNNYGAPLYLVFQDKVFWDPARDPGYAARVPGVLPGDLWYPYIYEKAIWKMQGNAKAAPIPSAIPEMFGDTMLVNGMAYPKVAVDAGTHRLITLNACNARFLNLKFVYEDPNVLGQPLGGYLAPLAAPVTAYMVATEGGYLPNAIPIWIGGNPANPLNLTPWLQAPAERSEMLVDFSACPNSKVLLYNDAPAPYPVGAPIFDWYPGAPGNPNAAAIGPNVGPNTRTIMRFEVGSAPTPPRLLSVPALYGPGSVMPTVPDAVNGGLALNIAAGGFMWNGVNYTLDPVQKQLTLNEDFDAFGRLMQLLGTNVAVAKGRFGTEYLKAVPEQVNYGKIQIWNIFNLTADVHPMHFHLFNVMVLRRRLFRNFNGIPTWAGLGRGPDPGEEGWKETVKMWPGECTTVAILVEHPLPTPKYGRDGANRPIVNVTPAVGTPSQGTLPVSPRIGGDEYVWHCHILEHEEHDMMHPLQAI